MRHDTLDADAVRSVMGAAADALRLEVVDSIDSTNSAILRRGLQGGHRLAVLADHQARGRGRRGRRWQSPAGQNLYLSLGWRFSSQQADFACLPLVVAIAAARALGAAGLDGHGIKWPNDLVLNDCKLGGCLVEVRSAEGSDLFTVCGIGINVRMTDTEAARAIDQPWTDLSEALPDIGRSALAGHLLDQLLRAFEEFEARGFGPFRAAWRDLDRLQGTVVTLNADAASFTGVARGIGRHGGLLVEGDDGVVEHALGEVSFRAPTLPDVGL